MVISIKDLTTLNIFQTPSCYESLHLTGFCLIFADIPGTLWVAFSFVVATLHSAIGFIAW